MHRLFHHYILRIGQQDTARRLSNYLDKYQSFIYAISIIAGFHCAIDFCQSKLFYRPIFYLPLTKEEKESVNRFRFVSIVILEVK